jgi:hypothetical protein
MYCNPEIDEVSYIDRRIQELEWELSFYTDRIVKTRGDLRELFNRRSTLMFWYKKWLREVLASMDSGQSVLIKRNQHIVCAYLKRVSGKRFKTKKDWDDTIVYCL